jgi:hypothetical protein
MTLKEFFSTPLFRFLIHFVIIVGFWINIWNVYRIWDMDYQIQNELRILSLLEQQNSDNRNQRDYFTSDLYEEKYAKQENFKLRDEEVIDTSVIEPSNQIESSSYIGQDAVGTKSNVEKWYEFIFGAKEEI